MKRLNPEQIALIQSWSQRAEEDLKAAKTLLKSEGEFLNTVCFHCHQSAEKFIKALLTFWQVPFPKTHDLSELLKLVAKRKTALAVQLEPIIRLNPYAVTTRYPGGIDDLDQKEAKEAVGLAELVRKEVNKIIKSPTA